MKQSNKELVDLQRIIVPEIGQLIEVRYNILSTVKHKQPIGRRHLAAVLDMSERQVRNEIEFLQLNKLISVERQGVLMTPFGEEVLNDMENMLYDYNRLEQKEHVLAEWLGIKKVIITPGNSAYNDQVLKLMGRNAAQYFLSVLNSHDIVALSGGKSTACIPEQLRDCSYPEVCFIPARGGMGKSHSIQANNVVAEAALKMRANYEQLHLPDNIGDDILQALKDYPEIRRVFDKLDHINIFIFGIGRADVMADSRNLDAEKKKMLQSKGAVAEAFGHYFDIDGQAVSPASTIGVSLLNYMEIENIIGVAGEASKAEAIIGVAHVNPNMVLVTDESAANEMLKVMCN